MTGFVETAKFCKNLQKKSSYKIGYGTKGAVGIISPAKSITTRANNGE